MRHDPSHHGVLGHWSTGESVGVLHLSDLHVGLDQELFLWPSLKRELKRDMERTHRICGPWDLVLFTGDLTQMGTDEEFQELDRVLDELLATIRDLGSDPVLLAVPGNHDLRRPQPNDEGATGLSAWAASKELQAQFWRDPNSLWRRSVSTAFKGWTDWWGRRRQDDRIQDYRAGVLPGEYCATVDVRGRKVGVAGLNTAALHLWPGDLEGRLTLHPRQLAEPCRGEPDAWAESHDLSLLLSHHPPSWLDHDGRRALNGEIYLPERFAMHLTGHVHVQGSEHRALHGGGAWRRIQGASLFGLETWRDWRQGESQTRAHGYGALRFFFDSGERMLRFWPREGRSVGEAPMRLDRQGGFLLEDDGGTSPVGLGPSPRRGRPPHVAPADRPAPGGGGGERRADVVREVAADEAPPPIELLHRLMNRSLQWEQLQTALARPHGHLVVSVFGSMEQDLELFCTRVRDFANERGSHEHSLHEVLLRSSGKKCRTPREVANRFIWAAGQTSGDLPRVLERIASRQPALFVVLRDTQPLFDLAPDEQRAIVEFLSDDLPRALANGRLRYPIRVLVAAQHGVGEGWAREDPLCVELHSALSRAQNLTHVMLPELALPPWTEVEHQLRTTFHVRQPDLLRRCHRTFDQVRTSGDATYRALAEAIVQALEPEPEEP